MSTNKAILLNEHPEGLPTLATFKVAEIPSLSAADLNANGVIIKLLFISTDPYMRGRMRPGGSGYAAGFQIGQPLAGGCVAEVTESKNADFPVGQLVVGMLPWKLVQVVENTASLNKIPRIEGISPSTAIGVLGMPGMTAYFGLLDITNPKEGETVVVSGAAGAVGSLVGQIAKIKGCRTVGIAGSSEKTQIMKDKYGYDEVLNYKDLDTFDKMKEALAKACPKGIDVYFDNTGGYISDAVMPLINTFARISVCGQISSYNEKDMYANLGPRTDFILIGKQAKKHGFLVFSYMKRYPEGMKQMGEWIKEGKIKYDETVVEGFENTGQAFIDMMTGKNIGKMIVKC
jgi:NADPH-dependent curcumin reductase CurA